METRITWNDQNLPKDINLDSINYDIQCLNSSKKEHILKAVTRLLYKKNIILIPYGFNGKIMTNEWSNKKWQIAMLTSGSTGYPKVIGLELQQLNWTVNKYRQIYGLTNRSLVATPLPVTYNFAFVAGVWLTAKVGSTFLYNNNQVQLIKTIQKEAENYDRVIVLANPIILQLMAEMKCFLGSNVLIDSGGAPLSKNALLELRKNIADVREGYGLTETCSLTHFDIEGTVKSLRTVGKEIRDVNTITGSNESEEGEILIKSPNCGVHLSPNTDILDNSYLKTGDIGRMDSFRRLRILGRVQDNVIRGYWPADILDVIGEVIGYRCASIQTPTKNSIIIRMWGKCKDELKHKIKKSVVDILNLPNSAIQVYEVESLLHSYKIPRIKN